MKSVDTALTFVDRARLHFQPACRLAIPGSVDMQTRLIALTGNALYKRITLSLASTHLHFWFLPLNKRRFMLVDSVVSVNTSRGGRHGY